MTTTTIELIDWLNKCANTAQLFSAEIAETYRQAAQRLRDLDLVTKEYDELVRHMDAGGDFTAFMVSKSFKEST